MRRKLRELNYDVHSEIKRKSKTIKIRNIDSIKLIQKIILDDAREKVTKNEQVYKKNELGVCNCDDNNLDNTFIFSL
ncbi:MAG: hypothetical protein KGM16_06920 [Bacteroidota bacterium]|nr:hypothetical protein [Bacteroidota bacterium]